jgi:hypothetical protein
VLIIVTYFIARRYQIAKAERAVEQAAEVEALAIVDVETLEEEEVHV